MSKNTLRGENHLLCEEVCVLFFRFSKKKRNFKNVTKSQEQEIKQELNESQKNLLKQLQRQYLSPATIITTAAAATTTTTTTTAAAVAAKAAVAPTVIIITTTAAAATTTTTTKTKTTTTTTSHS